MLSDTWSTAMLDMSFGSTYDFHTSARPVSKNGGIYAGRCCWQENSNQLDNLKDQILHQTREEMWLELFCDGKIFSQSEFLVFPNVMEGTRTVPPDHVAACSCRVASDYPAPWCVSVALLCISIVLHTARSVMLLCNPWSNDQTGWSWNQIAIMWAHSCLFTAVKFLFLVLIYAIIVVIKAYRKREFVHRIGVSVVRFASCSDLNKNRFPKSCTGPVKDKKT